MPVIEVNPDLCKRCFTCTQICPVYVFEMENKESPPKLSEGNLPFCLACGHCAAACPGGAISHPSYPPGSILPINKEILPGTDQAVEMLRSRRSIREFKDKPVEKDLIEKVLEVASCAPSDHNRQSTEYVIVQNESTLNEIKQITISYYENLVQMLGSAIGEGTAKPDFLLELEGFVDILKTGQDLLLCNAPTVIFFHAEESMGFPAENANINACYTMLAGMALGLGSFYAGFVVMACRDDSPIPGLLSLPDNHKIHAALAMGYPKFKYSKWIKRQPAGVTWIT